MKLADALADMKEALIYENGEADPVECKCACCCATRLVTAIEAHLEAEKESTHAMRRVVQ